jgi:hypothetical protein
MPDGPAGLLDTNVFIHAHTTDANGEECRRFLAALEAGSVSCRGRRTASVRDLQ